MTTSNRTLNSFVVLWLRAVAVSALFLNSQVYAATVQQVKNNKVLINLEGTVAEVGDHFYILDESKKKTGLIEITALKTDKAVALITKGKVKPNDTLVSQKNGASTTPSHTNPESKTLTSFLRFDLKKIAVNLKLSSDVISTLQQDNSSPYPNKETVDLKGTNIGLNATLGLPVNKNLSIQGYAGYEMLKISGTALRNVCNGKISKDCNADISYLSFGALGRWNFVSNHFQYWIGAGVGFKQPLTKKSTALTLENITLANSGIAALGLDYHLNNKMFIPASFEYHKSFNESDSVPLISHMNLQIGLGLLY